VTFEPDDLDWAMGALLNLFDQSNLLGVLPNELDPGLFFEAWSVMCSQPFEVTQRNYLLLTSKLRRPIRSLRTRTGPQRYAYVVAR
jgi:hypothetical protein